MANEVINRLAQLVMHKGVELPVFMQEPVFKMYETYKMPEDKLISLSKEDTQKYVKGLYKCTQEMAGDWTKGHEMLVELGFEKQTREEGHRIFTSLVWGE